VKVTDTLQVPCGGIEPVQLFAEIAKFALTATLEITRLAGPAFCRVVVRAGLATPIADFPKSRVDPSMAPNGIERPVP